MVCFLICISMYSNMYSSSICIIIYINIYLWYVRWGTQLLWRSSWTTELILKFETSLKEQRLCAHQRLVGHLYNYTWTNNMYVSQIHLNCYFIIVQREWSCILICISMLSNMYSSWIGIIIYINIQIGTDSAYARI